MAKPSVGLIFLFALAICSLPARAQQGSVALSICNMGKADVDLFVAKKSSPAERSHIVVGHCARVYDAAGEPPSALIGFALVDSHGQWGPAHRLDFFPTGSAPVEGSDQKLPVMHGNRKISLPMQMLFNPGKSCRTLPQYSYVQHLPFNATPWERMTAENEDANRPPPTTVCDDVAFAFGVIAYPDTREIAFPDECPQCPANARPLSPARQAAANRLAGDITSGQITSMTMLTIGQLNKPRVEKTPEGPQPFQRVSWKDLSPFLSRVFYGNLNGNKVADRNIVVRGTVSRVVVGPKVDIYFRESPVKEASVCSQRPGIFQDMFGPDFAHRMIGKTLDVEGKGEINDSSLSCFIDVSLLHQLRGTTRAVAGRMSEEDFHKQMERWDAEDRAKAAQQRARVTEMHQRKLDELAREDALRRSIADFDPSWVGKNDMFLKGTVSRVEVKPALPEAYYWVTAYFKESPGGAFVICFATVNWGLIRQLPEGSLRGRNDFSGLVGKTIQVEGRGKPAFVSWGTWRTGATMPPCTPNSAGMTPPDLKVRGLETSAANSENPQGQESQRPSPDSTQQNAQGTSAAPGSQIPGSSPRAQSHPVSIPWGTAIAVRVVGGVDSSKDHTGSKLAGKVDAPIAVAGQVVVPKGADAEVELLGVGSASNPTMQFRLLTLTVNGKTYNVAATMIKVTGTSSQKPEPQNSARTRQLGSLLGGFGRGYGGRAIGTAASGLGRSENAAGARGSVQTLPAGTKMIFTLQGGVAITP